MATKYYNWDGKFKWAKIHENQKDTKFNPDGVYNIAFYPKDKKTWTEIQKSGIRTQVKQDEDGEYISLSRRHKQQMGDDLVVLGPPSVFLNKEPFDGAIGNGSEGTVNVAIFDSRYGKGHRLNAINVTELIEYEGSDNHTLAMPF